MRTTVGRLVATFAAVTFVTVASGAHAGDRSSLTSEKGGAGEQTYLKLELENVLISSYNISGAADDASTYGDAGEQTYLAVELENVQ
jgi:type VI protein secretion system component Hcp